MKKMLRDWIPLRDPSESLRRWVRDEFRSGTWAALLPMAVMHVTKLDREELMCCVSLSSAGSAAAPDASSLSLPAKSTSDNKLDTFSPLRRLRPSMASWNTVWEREE